MVFQLGDSYDQVPGGVLRLDDPVVVDAVAVAIVNTQHVLRVVTSQLPTRDPQVAVILRVRFHCWVNDPLLVVESGCWDIDPLLVDHVSADRKLAFLTTDVDVNREWAPFQRNIRARFTAYHDLHPFVVPGLATRLVDVAVEPQRLVTVPKARSHHESTSRPSTPNNPSQASPNPDGDPAFVPDNYSWEAQQ